MYSPHFLPPDSILPSHLRPRNPAWQKPRGREDRGWSTTEGGFKGKEKQSTQPWAQSHVFFAPAQRGKPAVTVSGSGSGPGSTVAQLVSGWCPFLSPPQLLEVWPADWGSWARGKGDQTNRRRLELILQVGAGAALSIPSCCWSGQHRRPPPSPHTASLPLAAVCLPGGVPALPTHVGCKAPAFLSSPNLVRHSCPSSWAFQDLGSKQPLSRMFCVPSEFHVHPAPLSLPT